MVRIWRVLEGMMVTEGTPTPGIVLNQVVLGNRTSMPRNHRLTACAGWWTTYRAARCWVTSRCAVVDTPGRTARVGL